MKDVKITYQQIPKTIEVDGKKYPVHMHNIKVVAEYEKSKDESVLDKLADFALDI